MTTTKQHTLDYQLSKLSKEQTILHNQLLFDLPFSASRLAKIKDKDGNLVPLILNRAQMELHNRLESQLKRKGRVRMIVVKGRQLGSTTYIDWRFYRKSTASKGKSTFILSHEAATTDRIFNIVKRYHDNMPGPLQPSLLASNRKELRFAELDSEYYVGTAGNAKVGVGGTIQYFHGSEAALWENDAEIIAGVLQSIGRGEGTEIIFESTARGMGNRFYELAMQALDENGEGDYEVCFLPWFWDPGYAETPPPSFSRTAEEEELRNAYGLSDAQLYWRRLKIIEFGGDVWMFAREYPNNVMEAFQTSAEGLLNFAELMQARKNDLFSNPYAPKILGVDPAGDGKMSDRTTLVLRQGKNVLKHIIFKTMRPMELASIVASLVKQYDIDGVFIDYAHGIGTIDRLWQLGYRDCVFPVHFNAAPFNPNVYANKRTEMAFAVKLWLGEGGCHIPDDEEFYADCISIPSAKENGSGLLLLPPKLEIKKKLKKSTDIFDGLALTFAGPIRTRNPLVTALNDPDYNRKKIWTNASDVGSMVRRRKSQISVLNISRSRNGEGADKNSFRVRNELNRGGESVQSLNWIGRG